MTHCGHIWRSRYGIRPFCDTPGTLNPASAGNTGSSSLLRIQLWVIFSMIHIFQNTCSTELYFSDIFVKYNLNNPFPKIVINGLRRPPCLCYLGMSPPHLTSQYEEKKNIFQKIYSQIYIFMDIFSNIYFHEYILKYIFSPVL